MNLASIFGTTAVAEALAAVESAPTMKAQHNDRCNDSSVKVELQHNLSLQQQWRHNGGLCETKLLSSVPCSMCIPIELEAASIYTYFAIGGVVVYTADAI